MRLFRPFYLSGWIYPGVVYRIKTTEKLLCLTFDDGPDPGSTPYLLEVLEIYGVKAIFFCNGRSSERYPDLIEKIISSGHIVGNHGYDHPDGWKTSLKKYIADIENSATFTSANLFRPPYGRLSPFQYLKLKKTYSIFLWDVMPYDFDTSFGADNCLRVLKKKIRPGSIIVLHDHANSMAKSVIKDFIEFAIHGGYRFTIYID